ncbi:MAG: PaaX family transcriptional regulator [Janthinobacterium lividum]
MSCWAELDAVQAAWSTAPPRTGSVISTIYGDAILPRGGSLAAADLLVLMRRLGASEGVVRTALHRLAQDGVLVARRSGRTSAYSLSERSRAKFDRAGALIYGPLDRAGDHPLHLAFPATPEDRAALEAAGFAALAPGAMLGTAPAPGPIPWLRADGPLAHRRSLAARAWPVDGLAEDYRQFVELFSALTGAGTPLDTMAARTMLLHSYRRLALRTPRLPAGLLVDDWPGHSARRLCIELYARWAPGSEAWLDQTQNGSGPLPRGPDPLQRFSAALSGPA